MLGVTPWMKLRWKLNTLFGLWPRALLLDELRRHRASLAAIHSHACRANPGEAALDSIRDECERRIDALRFMRPDVDPPRA